MTPWADTILLLALVGTSACVVPMYLKLKRLDRTQAEYGRILTRSGHALTQAGDAVRSFSTEGREILEALDQRIGEARQTLAELEASRQVYKLLAEQAEAAGDATAAKKHTDSLEAAVRLARMDLNELTGLPLPCKIFSGAAMTIAPTGGSRSRLARHCRPSLPLPCMMA